MRLPPDTYTERMSAALALMDDTTCERIAAEMEDEDFAHRVYVFIRGARGKRKNPVTCRQIDDYFHGYSRKAVSDALNMLILDGRVRIMMRSLSSRRRANGAYWYACAATETE